MGAPNPGLAAFLGLIPGVGAMYNGQFLKGLVHVVIFAVLVSAAHVFGLFGLLIAGWVFYQVFDAYHTAKARRDGEPLPDPLGLNDVGHWFGVGGPQPGAQTGFGMGAPGTGPANANQQTGAAQNQGTSQAPYQNPYRQGPIGEAQWQTPYQGPGPGTAGPGAMGPGAPFDPNAPGMPPMHWRRKEPIGAVILIALGLLFLMGRLDLFSGRAFEFGWPVLLIGLGVWLIVRRMQDSHVNSQGGPK
jgi:TM2 domain-containing membrane protein YozV